MRYEYSGYLRSLLHGPDPRERDSLDHIEFTAEELSKWRIADDDTDREWQNVPARCELEDGVVLLQGYFEDVRRLEVLDPDDPSFWVPLTSRNSGDNRFPIDCSRYPVIEITYRCRTPNARPAWQWRYPGGLHFDGLQPSTEWRRISRLLHYRNFPSQIDDLTVRLYGTSRATEALEIQSIRFRALSPGEDEACRKNLGGLEQRERPQHFPILDEFMPMGVFMKAGVAKRLAAAMDVSFRDYWRLALEDVARYHHNCVALEEINAMTQGEWRELLGLAASFNIKLLAIEEWPLEDFDRQGQALVDRYITPHAESSAILGWSICDEPPEHTFTTHLKARRLIERVDPNHPVVVMLRDPNSYALFGPHFAASGIGHFKSGAAWELGEKVRTHLPLNGGQQFWVMAPAFVYGTDTPEWNTCPEMRLMINLAFANGARGWFSFSYHNDPIWGEGAFQRSLTGPFLTFSDLWSELGHRMERFHGLAPLLLNASPTNEPGLDIEIMAEPHPFTRKPEHLGPIQWQWLRGKSKDFWLLYIVSNDIGEVTSVNIHVPEQLPQDAEVYDMTDFVRKREWTPMARRRHIEMFPGQGQLIFFGAPPVCEHWRDLMIEAIIADDRRQLGLDLSLARRYEIDIRQVQEYMRSVGMGTPLEDLRATQAARDLLVNLLYRAPRLVQARSKLVEASAGICGCDGALCRLLASGRIEETRELGHQVVALTKDLTRLRIQLRRGRGMEILDECTRLAEAAVKLLGQIRGALERRKV